MRLDATLMKHFGHSTAPMAPGQAIDGAGAGSDARAPQATSFGRRLLEHWHLDPDAVYLNHGTVGATPRRVLQAQAELIEAIERHPARFVLRELVRLDAAPLAAPMPVPRLRAAATAVAARLGAKGGDLVFVDNATAGINAVLRSLAFAPGDEIVLTDLGYGAMTRVAAHVAQISGARVVTATMPFPDPTRQGCVAALSRALSPRTRLALIDHVTSETALVLPLAEMAARCRDAGVAVLVDGAHAPAALALDLPALGVDWYAANLHKWAFAPRGTGILWANPARQAGLHPAVISWGYNQRWDQEFDWTGTRDPSAWLTAPAGWHFIDEVLGGEAAMRRHNHALAWHAATALASRWGLAAAAPEDMVGCMALVPLPGALGSGSDAARALQDALLFGHAIEVPVIARGDRLWLRVSAQVYNDETDIERLGWSVDAIARAGR